MFGGGRVLSNTTDVGAHNIAFVREFLHMEGMAVVAEDLGDLYPRRVIYFPATGRVRLKYLRAVAETREVASNETRYQAVLAGKSVGNEVELFD